MFHFISFRYKHYQIISVVSTFDIQNAAGKKVHVYDHLNTRIDDDDILKFVLKNNAESLVLKVVFFVDTDTDGGDVLITSEVMLQ